MEYEITKDIINKGSILSDIDKEYINKNITEIQNNWNKRQVFRTETEMRLSVLNDIKFPTAASKYWQCVREQSVFYENLVVLSFDYRRNVIEQKQTQIRIDKADDPLKKELLQIDLEEQQFKQINMQKTAQDRMREIRLWSVLMQEQIDSKEFDTENVNTHQLVSYAHRFTKQLENVGNASPSEMSNLVGQFNTTMRILEEKGLLTITEDKQLKIEG